MARRPIYYDTETTGIKVGKDRIVEIAAYDPLLDRKFCTFINPECPIPPEATAVTQITDAMVAEAPKIQEALASFIAFCPVGEVILIAHNNDSFDKPMLEAEALRAGLPLPSWEYIDSLKWSRKYRSDLPRHTLQSLREVYGIEANQAHRALDDVVVLHRLFTLMTDELPIETVLQLLKTQPQTARMPFGKHAGKPLADVPKDYVSWLLEQGALDKKENRELKEQFQKLGLLAGKG